MILTGCGTFAEKPGSEGMALVPAGEFTMGSNKEDNLNMWREANALNPYGFNEQLYVNEHPAHKLTLPAFMIDKYEVTNAEYKKFTTYTKHSIPSTWRNNGYTYTHEMLNSASPDELRQVAADIFLLDMDVANMRHDELITEIEKIQALRDTYPVTMVAWSDASDYCTWADKRLPTEAEWEKAARGTQGFEYPWGNSWDAKKINTMSDEPGAPYSPVGSYPTDKSPYGVYDMAANVAEWVADWYETYPDSTYVDKSYGKNHRVVRGGMASSGHYDSISLVFRGAKRTHLRPYTALIDLGFRCAKDVE